MKLTINQKLVLVYLGIFIVPSILFSVMFYSNIKAQEKRDRIKMMEEKSLLVENTVQKNIDMFSNIEWNILDDYGLLDFIASEKEKTSMDYVNFNRDTIKTISRIMGMNQSIYQIRIFSQNSNSLEIWPHLYNEKHLHNTDFYKQIIEENKEIYWHLNHKEDYLIYKQNPNQTVVSFYRRIEYPAGHYVGLLEISMLAEDFWGMDGYDSVLLKPQNLNMRMIAISSGIHLSQQDLTQMAGSVRLDTGESFVYTAGNETFAVAPLYIEHLGAVVMNVSDLSEQVARLNEKRNLTVAFTLLLLAVISSVTVMATSKLMKKMKIITKHVNKMQEGNLDVKIPLDGRDEFGVLAASFNRMGASIKELIQNIIQEETAAKTAELGALQAQIDSHFLYNTLENIKMKAVLANEYDLANDVTMLGKLMRYNLNWKSNFVPLKEELAHIRNYFALVSLRNSNRFQLTIKAEERYYNVRIHKMILQPLVENALVHGLEGQKSGEVSVIVFEENGKFFLQVRDSGVGFAEPIENKPANEVLKTLQNTHHKSNGIAIQNVYERLKLYYQDGAEVYVSSKPGQYTCISIQIDKNRVEL